MRHKLSNRHSVETVEFTYNQTKFTLGYSRFPNGNVAEVFINGGKVGSMTEALMRDIGVVLSIVLQHGVLISDIQRSVTRLDDESPAGPLGVILDKLNAEW